MNLKHTALYAKHWYKRTDIVEDVKKCLEADNYTPFTTFDVINILISNVSPILIKNHDITYYTRELINSIDSKECWKCGYYTKDHSWIYTEKEKENLPDYNYYIAIIYYFLSALSCMDIKELGGFDGIIPNKSVLPLSEDVTKAKIKSVFK